MSLIRICAFSKCLYRRSLFQRCIPPVTHVDYCRLCFGIRNGPVRHISETHWLQQRHFSPLLPRKDETTTRVLKQTQLLDVLEARIQQLQSDGILDIQHVNVQVLKAPKSGKGSGSGKSPKSTLREKGDLVKPKQTLTKGAAKSQSSKTQPSRWLQKLSQEKTNKIKREQVLQKKNVKETPPTVKAKPHKDVKETPTTKPQAGLMTPGRSYKTVSSPAAMIWTSPSVEGSEGSSKWADKMRSAAALSAHKASKRKSAQQAPDVQAQGQPSPELLAQAQENAEVEELEKRLSLVSDLTSSASTERLLGDREPAVCSDAQFGIRSYLEACVFSGDLERANRFLLSQHRILSRRKLLDVGMYNTVMRIWAKKGTLNQIGRIFILVEEAGLKPNLGSYCAALECMGRSESCPRVVSRCLNHLEEEGLSLDNLFGQFVFRQDERDMVLKAVCSVKPEYRPVSDYLTPDDRHPSLVQDLYLQREGHHYPKLDFTREELQERFGQQLEVEQGCTVTIDSVETVRPITEHIANMRTLLDELRSQWRKTLLAALKERKMILASTKSRDYKLNLYPYLCLLDDKEYVDIMIQSVSNLPLSGESLKVLARDLGNRVYTKCSIRQKGQDLMVEKLGSVYSGYTDLLAKDTEDCLALPREQWLKLEAANPSGPTLQGEELQWPYIVSVELGTYMVDLMVKNLKINSDILNPAYERKLIPILYHMYTFRSTRQVGFIKPHPLLTQIQQDATETRLTFDSYVMPMLCPPVPWISAKYGGYLLSPTKLMRSTDGATQHERLLERCRGLHPVLDSLNQLGSCAWRVNGPLLDIVVSVFNRRGSDKLGVPPPLSEAPRVPHFNANDPAFTSAEKAHMKKEVVKAKKKYSEMHSLRMDALYKLSIASHMRDKKFWFPHNMDFRGRTYPCPPHFNHLGSDVTRALLVFAEGKALGAKGLDWVKIHLVNLTGLRKRSSLEGRLEYANSLMEEILDSADNPLNGRKWWMDADEPWQALGCCMEIANAVRAPDPAQYISHFPVHQDGSCNGLQHYAALGRDVIGATSVNLMPCDVPQDVYSGVAQQVEEFRARDAEKGLKIAQVLEGYISRKVVKQTVMTLVYGVTRYGGRLQIEKRLKEIEEFPKEYVWDASHYLVRQVFSGLKEMFTGTREIQDWLTDSARLISKSGRTVEWVTPLGLPIIQPYHRARNQVLKHDMQDINLQISHDDKERPDTVKQKNAFPPNFIHSLDSTHMMLTSLNCYSAGLTFVSVHDCFWTHAVTVDTMNKVCREQFVALHSQPILQELSNFLLLKYCSELPADGKKQKYQEYRRLMLMLGKVPQTGDFDLQRVKESTFFFS
ncbi:DNA-directed RNA polymerase, mitochondrial isoform X1 [Gadus chalcogrammus]|uniref:DNA-directed RNA polymerase, mitochondrial isoform X1 n=1 Tax=Gadus chalcogrammus TaxID=1042646 RepID=UPI0024C4ADFB|nr:DNA-directed RNA polymerase, mitochondrial isoform X1 [Gadus chalcogrammus]